MFRADVEPGSGEDAAVEQLMAEGVKVSTPWLPGLVRTVLRGLVLVFHGVSVDE